MNLSTQIKHDNNTSSWISKNNKVAKKRRESQQRYNINSELFKSVSVNNDTLLPSTTKARYEQINRFEIDGINTIAYERSKYFLIYITF